VWDVAYPDPNTGNIIHRVEGQHLNSSNLSIWPAPLTLARGYWNSEYPVIEWLGNAWNDPTRQFAMVAWQDDRHTNCAISTAIFEQLLDLSQAVASDALQWTPNGQINGIPVGPGGTEGNQTLPLLARSINGSGTVFWIDNRWSGDNVLGTRVTHTGYQYKQVARSVTKPVERTAISMLPVYPQPYSSAGTVPIVFPFRLDDDAEVWITITDALGKVVWSRSAGQLSRGQHSIALSRRDGLHLTPGLYSFSVLASGQNAVQLFLVTR
jgi:hypothetical protein